MQNKKIIIIVSFILIILSISLYFIFKPEKKEIKIDDKYEMLQHKIDSLENIKDSLNTQKELLLGQIDSSENKVIVIEHWYEKEHNNILTQPSDSDYVFFKDYLSR